MNNSKKLFFSAVLIGTIFTSCKKEDDTTTPDTTTPTPTTTCTLQNSSEVRDSSNNSETYTYDANGRIIKVAHSNTYGQSSANTWYDSIVYNSNGEINTLFEIQTNSDANKTYTYTYSGGKISLITEQGINGGLAYTKTYTYTYSGGNLSEITTAGDPNNENQAMKNITFSNGNISSLAMDADGSGAMVIEMTVSQVDSKKNYAKHLVPTPDNMIEYYNSNNLVKVVTVNQELIPSSYDPVTQTIIYDTIPAGGAILNRTLTYNSNNEVTTMVELPGAFDSDAASTTKTYTYECK